MKKLTSKPGKSSKKDQKNRSFFPFDPKTSDGAGRVSEKVHGVFGQGGKVRP